MDDNGGISTETFHSHFSSGVLFTSVLESLMFKERSNFIWFGSLLFIFVVRTLMILIEYVCLLITEL